MKAYKQQQDDYIKLLSALVQKANYEEKQFDFNVAQPFIQSAEQAKAHSSHTSGLMIRAPPHAC